MVGCKKKCIKVGGMLIKIPECVSLLVYKASEIIRSNVLIGQSAIMRQQENVILVVKAQSKYVTSPADIVKDGKTFEPD